MKLINFPCKKAYYVNRLDFFHNFFLKSAFYGLDTVQIRNRNRNLFKVGTETGTAIVTVPQHWIP
jgi:hypothetical protein